MAEQTNYSFSVLNVGQGSLQLIEGSDSLNVVIDCNLQGADEFVIGYFARRKVKRIDLLILSGTDADHADADGLAMMKRRWSIQRLWYPDFQKDEETENWKKVRALIEELKEGGTIVETPKAGDCFELGSLTLEVLSPHDEDSTTSNNASIVVRIAAGDVHALFPGDCENERWDGILEYFEDHLPAHVLLAPHHGSDHGSHEDSLAVISPEYTVISAGEDNKYGHPDKNALELLKKYTREEVLLTCEDGSVLFESDGESITNVVRNAGRDDDGKKASVRAVATALGSRAPVFVRGNGTLGTHAVARFVPARPTVFHGGRESENDEQEVD